LPARTKGYITFSSLHSLAKLNEGVFDLWSRALRAVPDSRLLLFRDTLRGSIRESIRRQWCERGIDEGRLELRHQADKQGYLGVYREIDISLDVFPWSGGTTTCESLWMGVPIPTLQGTRHASRGTATVLTSLGLTDLIADTPEHYVALLAHLARDWDRLTRLRAGLRDLMRATICDGQRLTQELEEAYRAMWRRWCVGRRGACSAWPETGTRF
jgi:predicted O-linked N-acetylglucosamine transferase (SPINDLY family)